MDDLILELVARAGPLVILSGLFLLWDYYRGKFDAERWARRDKEFTDLVARVGDALRSNADALSQFGERMLTRPCLWEQNTQRLIRSLEQACERIADARATHASEGDD